MFAEQATEHPARDNKTTLVPREAEAPRAQFFIVRQQTGAARDFRGIDIKPGLPEHEVGTHCGDEFWNCSGHAELLACRRQVA